MQKNIELILDNFNNRNFEKLKNSIDQNAEVQLPNGTILNDIENVLNKWKEFIEIFPDIKYTHLSTNFESPYWKTDVRVSGTFTKDLTLPNGNIIKANGNKLDMKQRINFQFDGNEKMIFEKKEYDMKEFLEQLQS